MTEKELILVESYTTENEAAGAALSGPMSSAALAKVPRETQGLLLRMFRDPYLLEKPERRDLADRLRSCVRQNPEVAELRVLLGMALCVNFEVPDAIEELRESVRLDPNSYIAQLKMGELWMRLRVMDKAEEHTRRAGLLASNMAQSELARRQGASIRAMKHAGIERGGYKSPWLLLTRVFRRLSKQRPSEMPAVLESVDAN
jgi:tetratricopeptide (TPR) repeat protein